MAQQNIDPYASFTQEAPCAFPAKSTPITLGAHLCDGGADFAVRAPLATRVDVCLLEETATGVSEKRWSLHNYLGTWSGFVPDVQAGQLYGYRVHGKYDPQAGLRHNPAKLLLDPYARAIGKKATLDPSLYGHLVNNELRPLDGRLAQSPLDSAPYAPWGAIVPDGGAFASENRLDGTEQKPITHPFIPWEKTVIYEAHVRGLTALNPHIPADLRGTYAGIAHPWMVNYLKRLGITALELLPIHASFSEPFLAGKGLENYWGYNTLSYFAPEPSYATKAAQEAGSAAVIAEVKHMVNTLHEAGIEVICDVVFNHTCEGGSDGPSLSWRGFDQTSYYMLDNRDPSTMVDMTGCGNTIDFRRRAVISLTLDSLRYWVADMGVDGFRFDLAVTLGRNGEHFDSHHPLYIAMTTDPLLSHVKLINEPWDVGPNGWQTGRFLDSTADWNDHFRDTVRSFWVTQPRALHAGGIGGDLRDLATRLAGSADLFGHGRTPGGRGTFASINFVTAHDGFTMRDVVSFDSKHNESNREDNRDGAGDNKSWNHGREGIWGESNDDLALAFLDDDLRKAGIIGTSALLHGEDIPASISAARQQTMRNLFATLLLSAGTPMLTQADEIARTQLGNNNCYCQNNVLSWVNWDVRPWQKNLHAHVSYLVGLRRAFSVLRPRVFYSEGGSDSTGMLDLQWLAKGGQPMPEHAWFDPHTRLLQMLRSGRCQGPDCLIVINGSLESEAIVLPSGHGHAWIHAWSSTWNTPRRILTSYAPNALTRIPPLSLQVYLSSSPNDHVHMTLTQLWEKAQWDGMQHTHVQD